MKRHFVLVACLALLCFTVGVKGQETKKNEEIKDATAPSSLMATTETKYVPVIKYDPARDADKDIQNALTEARRTKKRVLLEVGGLWCIWCRHMDAFFEKQRDVLAFREKYFVTLKVNYSDEAKNEDVLSRYPKIAGYPHIFILDAEGTLLHSQETGELEEGKGYNVEKFATFLKQWAKAPIDTGLKSGL